MSGALRKNENKAASNVNSMKMEIIRYRWHFLLLRLDPQIFIEQQKRVHGQKAVETMN